MANIKSQIKRNKTNEKAHERNKAVKSELKTEVRRTREAIAAGDKAAAEKSRDDAVVGKAAAEAARDAARRAAESGDSSASAASEDLAKAAAELAAVRAQSDSAAQAAADAQEAMQSRIDALESDLRAATEASATSAAPTADHDERVAELEQTIEQLRAAAASPAASGGGGAQTAIVLQTIRSAIDQHKNRIVDDEESWKQKEVAIGKAIQELLAMVQKDPSNRNMVYSLLNDLQGVLDVGRTLVNRNRQFVEEEANAISELEKNL